MARILLGVPSSGTICESSSHASWLSSLHHEVHRVPSCISGPNYNACLVRALNACDPENGPPRYDAHAQIHADLQVVEKKEACRHCHGEKCFECGYNGEIEYERWADVVYREMVESGADFISVAMAIKDHRHATSCGVGNPDNRWNPWRRFTTKELATVLPKTFSAEDIGYGDKYLIHNHALCMFNMHSPIWWKTDASGCIRAMFNFEERLFKANGEWMRIQDSEDWAFSRRLWELGAKTVITSKVKTLHHGSFSFENDCQVGSWQNGDEDTSSQWRKDDPIGRREFSHASKEPGPTGLPE